MPPAASKPRILLVDDNRDNLRLMRLYLGDGDYVVEEAADGHEAVARCTAAAYDLIFMDLEMPRLDGYNATGAIRDMEERENRPPAPIVVITAHDLDEFRDRCQEAGCTDYLVKPVRKAAILAVLDRFLGRAAPPPAEEASVDRERLRRLLPLFYATARETLGAAQQALSRGDTAAAGREGHKLKGAALCYGLDALGGAAADLERAGAAGDAAHAATACDRALLLLEAASRAG